MFTHCFWKSLKTEAHRSWLQVCLAWCLKDRNAEPRWNVNNGQPQSKQPFVSGWQEVVTLPCLDLGPCVECNLWGCWLTFRSHQAEDRRVLFVRYHWLWCLGELYLSISPKKMSRLKTSNTSSNNTTVFSLYGKVSGCEIKFCLDSSVNGFYIIFL